LTGELLPGGACLPLGPEACPTKSPDRLLDLRFRGHPPPPMPGLVGRRGGALLVPSDDPLNRMLRSPSGTG
jgi:hypothetical protein